MGNTAGHRAQILHSSGEKSSPSPSTLLWLGLPELPLQFSPWAQALRRIEAFKHGEQFRCIGHLTGGLLYIDILLLLSLS